MLFRSETSGREIRYFSNQNGFIRMARIYQTGLAWVREPATPYTEFQYSLIGSGVNRLVRVCRRLSSAPALNLGTCSGTVYDYQGGDPTPAGLSKVFSESGRVLAEFTYDQGSAGQWRAKTRLENGKLTEYLHTLPAGLSMPPGATRFLGRSEEHTSELQSPC